MSLQEAFSKKFHFSKHFNVNNETSLKEENKTQLDTNNQLLQSELNSNQFKFSDSTISTKEEQLIKENEPNKQKINKKTNKKTNPKMLVPLLIVSDKHGLFIGPAPGKFDRNLSNDISSFFIKKSITHIVSILTDKEYKIIKIDYNEYSKLLKHALIDWTWISYIKDGFVPLKEDLDTFFRTVDEIGTKFEECIEKDAPFRLFVHCRLGKHRSGMFSACLMHRLKKYYSIYLKNLDKEKLKVLQIKRMAQKDLLNTANGSIKFLRYCRGAECINKMQEDCVFMFEEWLKNKYR